MTYLKTWHRDYAAESLKRAELNRFSSDANHDWLKLAIECGQVASLAKSVGESTGNQKVSSIADAVIQTIATNNKHKPITDAQRHTLAVAVLEHYGSARAVAKMLSNLTDEEINNADHK